MWKMLTTTDRLVEGGWNMNAKSVIANAGYLCEWGGYAACMKAMLFTNDLYVT